MPTALLLITLTIATGPTLPSGEVAEPGPLDLRGRWEGLWVREGDTDVGVVFQDGRFTLPMTPPAPLPFRMVNEGHGRFRAKLGDREVLGIYSRQDDRVVLCWRGVDRDRPTQIVDEECADVVVLRRVRAGR
jgi:hypothetical protein